MAVALKLVGSLSFHGYRSMAVELSSAMATAQRPWFSLLPRLSLVVFGSLIYLGCRSFGQDLLTIKAFAQNSWLSRITWLTLTSVDSLCELVLSSISADSRSILPLPVVGPFKRSGCSSLLALSVTLAAALKR